MAIMGILTIMLEFSFLLLIFIPFDNNGFYTICSSKTIREKFSITGKRMQLFTWGLGPGVRRIS
jgi:hypothetical protein